VSDDVVSIHNVRHGPMIPDLRRRRGRTERTETQRPQSQSSITL
jgi:hypothetical protein